MPERILINLEIALEIKAVVEGLDIFVVDPGAPKNLLGHSKGHEKLFVQRMVVEGRNAPPELRERIVGEPGRQDRFHMILPVLEEKIALGAESDSFVGIRGDDGDRTEA